MNETELRRLAFGGDAPPEDADAAFDELERREEERAERAADRKAWEELRDA